ncbi:MAG: hypothetical protein ACPGOY_10790 [Rhodospirillaceae bacterium]
MKHLKMLASAAVLAGFGLASPASAHDLGFAGLLSNGNKGEMPALTLSANKPVSEGPITLQSGMYYELVIVSDGSREMALAGSEFFHAIWVDEVVINDLEVRPFGLESVEFDDEGEMEIGFIAIKPGTYRLGVPGATGETQGVEITIK